MAVQKTMKALVIGSGVIGLTSAWYLRQAGFDVTVIDRQAQAALETSYANAGQLSYGYSAPWAAPGVPQKALKWLVQTHAPLKISPPLNAEMVGWSLKMLANCNAEKYQQNKSRMLRLANYSKSCLSELKERLPLNFEGKELGTLQVFRHASQLDSIGKDMHLLAQSGVEHHLLNVEQCIQKEPGLAAVKEKLTGGCISPTMKLVTAIFFASNWNKNAAMRALNSTTSIRLKRLSTKASRSQKWSRISRRLLPTNTFLQWEATPPLG